MMSIKRFFTLSLTVLTVVAFQPSCAAVQADESGSDTTASGAGINDTAADTATSDADMAVPKGKGASAYVLLSGVVGALVVSALLYREKDKGKYL